MTTLLITPDLLTVGQRVTLHDIHGDLLRTVEIVGIAGNSVKLVDVGTGEVLTRVFELPMKGERSY